MQAAGEQIGGPPLTSAALASRFGGGLVARLAASKALQSRQAGTEPSAGAASRTASEAATAEEEAPPASDVSEADPGAATAAPPSAAPDDEALLLSGLLNTASPAAQENDQGLLGRLQQRPAPAEEASRRSSLDDGTAGYSAEFSELLPAAGSSAVSLVNIDGQVSDGGGDTPGRDATQSLTLVGEDQPAAGSVTAAAAHSSQQRHSFQDAADDTVLTGSPQPSTAGGSSAGSPTAGSSAAEQEPSCRVSGLPPSAVPALSMPTAPQLASATAGAPLSQQPPARPPSASRSRLPKPPLKAAIPQQVWSFGAIPQGTASIPSRVPAAERRPAVAVGSGGRPAFYTRAASPPPRPSATAAGPPNGRMSGGPRESRRERLERLAQPKRPVQPVGRQAAAGPAAASRAGRLACKPGAVSGSKHASAAAECGGIAAWRPAHAGQPAAGAARPAAEAAQATTEAPSTAGMQQQGAPGSAAGRRASSTDRCWPAALGQPLEGAELQRATGAYSEERFQAHLARLQQALAPHRQRRQQEADAASAGVDELVARVRQLGTGAPSAAAAGSQAAPVAGISIQPVEEAAAPPLPYSVGMAPEPAGLALAEDPGSASIEGDARPPPAELPHSPTERLLGCQQHLQQRPLTAPGLGCGSPVLAAAQLRPTTGSPGKVKSLMQVKGEHDAALQQLRERPRPFRASPLPLSTMEPRYQQQVAQQEARRHAAHGQRRQQLLEQQRPFGFEERAAERAQRRQLLHGSGPGSPLAVASSSRRPATPPFHAQPVPVSTMEARYALLAAELQLQHRPRPGTAAVLGTARQDSSHPASPDRRPATAVPRWRPLIRPDNGGSTGLAATTAAVCFVAATGGEGDGGPEPPVPAAASNQQLQAGPASGSCHPCTASGPEQGSSSATAAAAAAAQPAREAAAPSAGAEAGEPHDSEHWEAEAGEASGVEPCSPASPPPDALVAGREGSPRLADAGQPPAAAAETAAATLGSSAGEEQGTAAAAQSAFSGGSPPLQPCTEHIQPAVAAVADEGDSSGAGASSCPAVQRLGSRGSSFAGEPASPEAGIAVPMACSGLGAVGAELLAASSMRGSVDSREDAAELRAAAAAGEERRDTPPQHIAARHQQVAAAARRVVEAALARRGLKLDGL